MTSRPCCLACTSTVCMMNREKVYTMSVTSAKAHIRDTMERRMEATMSRSSRTKPMPLIILAARSARKALKLRMELRFVTDSRMSIRGLMPSTRSKMFHFLLGPRKKPEPSMLMWTSSSRTNVMAKNSSTVSTHPGLGVPALREAMAIDMSTPMNMRLRRIRTMETTPRHSLSLAVERPVFSQMPKHLFVLAGWLRSKIHPWAAWKACTSLLKLSPTSLLLVSFGNSSSVSSESLHSSSED
mmetsp:Transcript_56512/g.159385  ORF Transcript_56512/g.159385 Transcript_56512/m.159385 type:complete len:241 (-) Transcript_56512:413-1135(-)